MNFTFESQGTNTYLVYTVTEETCVDSMSLGMLTNNKIAGLAPTLFTQMDETKYIKYNVSAKISAKQFFEGAVNKKRLLGVFKGIINALLSAEDYMIDTNTILLDMHYIFADVTTCETVLICLPVDGINSNVDLGTFFKDIMFTTQFDQTENCDHVAKIINYLNSAPVFSLADFKTIIESAEEGSITPSPEPKPIAQQPKVQPVEQKTEVKPKTVLPQEGPKSVEQVVAQPETAVEVPKKANNVQNLQTTHASVQQATSSQSTEKQISMFGLLMNYSKENAELYKAQKAAQKAAKAQGDSAKPQKAPKQSAKKQEKAKKASLATPAAGFAIPGQETPAPTPVAQPAQQTQAPQVSVPTNQPQPQMSMPATQPTQTQQVQPIQQPMPSVPPVQQAQTVQQAPAVSQVPVGAEVPSGHSMNFGETTILGGAAIGETTVLKAVQTPAKMIAPHLIRTKTKEKISLNKPVFRVGKERSYVDYFIGDNTAISRSHANFVTRDGEYYVVDTNSTNHTYINGEMIQSMEEIKLSSGDKIRLANEEFEFKLS